MPNLFENNSEGGPMEQCPAKWHEAGVDLVICVLGKGHEGLHNNGNIVWMGAAEFYAEDRSD